MMRMIFTKWSDSFLQRALFFAQSCQRLYSFLQFTNTASSIFTLWRYPITWSSKWHAVMTSRCSEMCATISGGSRGGGALPGRPNSFDFMQFSGKFGKIVCWAPPLGRLAPPPPPGKSWIRRWPLTFVSIECHHVGVFTLGETLTETGIGNNAVYDIAWKLLH